MFTGRFIYLNRPPSNAYERIVDRNASKLIKRAAVTTVVMILSFSLIIIGPVSAFIFRGEYNSLSGGIVPFTDLETLHGFMTNLIIRTACGIVAMMGSISIEILTSLIDNKYVVMSELACYSMEKFSAELTAGTFTDQNEADLRNIFVRLQDIENYSAELNGVYYWRFFLQPVLTTPCVSLAIFAQLEVRSTGGACIQFYNSWC